MLLDLYDYPYSDKALNQFQEIQEIVRFAEKLLIDFNNKNYKDTDLTLPQIIIATYLNKVIHESMAVLLILRKGFSDDAEKLLRSMVEMLGSIKYIYCEDEKKEDKCIRFVKHDVIQRYYMLKAYEESTDNQVDNTLKSEIESGCLEYETKYNIKRSSVKDDWSGIGRHEMAEIAGIPKGIYKSFYKKASNQIHFNIKSLTNYTWEANDNCAKSISANLCLIGLCLFTITEIFTNEFSISSSDLTAFNQQHSKFQQTFSSIG